MIPETMSCRERVEAAIALEKPDRTPVMPLMVSFPIRHRGMTQGEAWRDLDKAFQATLDTYDDLGGFDMLPKTNVYWPMLGGKFSNAPIRRPCARQRPCRGRAGANRRKSVFEERPMTG